MNPLQRNKFSTLAKRTQRFTQYFEISVKSNTNFPILDVNYLFLGKQAKKYPKQLTICTVGRF